MSENSWSPSFLLAIRVFLETRVLFRFRSPTAAGKTEDTSTWPML